MREIKMAIVEIKTSRMIQNFERFFILPRKIYNKGTIYIFKIRQSMQIYKNRKKVLDKKRYKW